DGQFNSADPVLLYSSNLYGDSLVQLSPEDQKFVDYFYYPKQQLILVKTVIDGDGDHIFSNTDETNMLEVQLNNPQMGKEVFSGSLKENLRQIILAQDSSKK